MTGHEMFPTGPCVWTLSPHQVLLFGEDSMGRWPSSRIGSLGVPKSDTYSGSNLNSPPPDPEVMNNPGCKFPSLKVQLPCFPQHDGLCLPESESQINISCIKLLLARCFVITMKNVTDTPGKTFVRPATWHHREKTSCLGTRKGRNPGQTLNLPGLGSWASNLCNRETQYFFVVTYKLYCSWHCITAILSDQTQHHPVST